MSATKTKAQTVKSASTKTAVAKLTEPVKGPKLPADGLTDSEWTAKLATLAEKISGKVASLRKAEVSADRAEEGKARAQVQLGTNLRVASDAFKDHGASSNGTSASDLFKTWAEDLTGRSIKTLYVYMQASEVARSLDGARMSLTSGKRVPTVEQLRALAKVEDIGKRETILAAVLDTEGLRGDAADSAVRTAAKGPAKVETAAERKTREGRQAKAENEKAEVLAKSMRHTIGKAWKACLANPSDATLGVFATVIAKQCSGEQSRKSSAAVVVKAVELIVSEQV
jgi:hypothetical protein